jgi:hypothetical protein
VEVTLQGDAVTQAATGLWFNDPRIKAQPLPGADGKPGGKFRVTVPAEVPVGLYDIRAAGPKGVTNARTFAVDDLPEATETEPNNTPSQATRLLKLPAIVNGRVNPAEDIDYFVFHGEPGQRLIIDLVANRIDATPAQAFLFDGTLELTAPGGKVVGFNTDFNSVDPFLDVTLPEAGDYTLKVWDFTYRGSDVCVYRMRIGQAPYVDYVFPAGGQRGTKVEVTYGGRNLPGGKPSALMAAGRPLDTLSGTVDVPKDAALPEGPLPVTHFGRTADALTERISVNLSSPAGTSNSRIFMVGELPETFEKEGNDSPETANKLQWPCVVNGQAGKIGDRDYFELQAKKGQTLSLEVFAQRLGSPMDSNLALYAVSADGKSSLVAQNEDANLNIPGDIFFAPRTSDSQLAYTAPADGTYRVLLRDLYGTNRGGPEFVYRLEIRAPEPDFRVVVVPDHRQGRNPDRQQVPQGGRMEWMIYAQRRGYNGEIQVEARGLPPGVTMEPLVFGPNVSAAQVVFYAAPETPPGTFAPVTFIARGTAGERSLARQVQISAITGPSVNTPTLQRLGRSAVVSVTDPVMVTATVAPAAPTVAAGGKLPVKVTLKRRPDWKGAVELNPPSFGFPNGIGMADASVAPDQSEATVTLDLPKNLAPGRYTLTVNVSGQVQQPNGGNQRETYPSSPIAFTVTP